MFEILPEPLEEPFFIGFTASPLAALTFSMTGKVATLSIAYKMEEYKRKNKNREVSFRCDVNCKCVFLFIFFSKSFKTIRSEVIQQSFKKYNQLFQLRISGIGIMENLGISLGSKNYI